MTISEAEDLMDGAKKVYDKEHSAWQERKAQSFSLRWMEKIKGKLGRH